jgi:hypothetical protein
MAKTRDGEPAPAVTVEEQAGIFRVMDGTAAAGVFATRGEADRHAATINQRRGFNEDGSPIEPPT